MRMAVLQHVPFEGPAAIAGWAASRRFEIAVAHLYRGDPLPALTAFDMLTVMGGPMSANDDALLPWLAPEIALVRNAIHADKIVLGVCLGAQIIAKALGARVYVGREKEIGWFPLQRTENSHPVFKTLPQIITPFHWHGETFDLPPGAVRLAETSVTPNQAFALGNRILACQFHLEATAESVNALLENAAEEIGDGPFEQQAQTIRAGLYNCAALRQHLDTVLDSLTRIATEGK